MSGGPSLLQAGEAVARVDGFVGGTRTATTGTGNGSPAAQSAPAEAPNTAPWPSIAAAGSPRQTTRPGAGPGLQREVTPTPAPFGDSRPARLTVGQVRRLGLGSPFSGPQPVPSLPASRAADQATQSDSGPSARPTVGSVGPTLAGGRAPSSPPLSVAREGAAGVETAIAESRHADATPPASAAPRDVTNATAAGTPPLTIERIATSRPSADPILPAAQMPAIQRQSAFRRSRRSAAGEGGAGEVAGQGGDGETGLVSAQRLVATGGQPADANTSSPHSAEIGAPVGMPIGLANTTLPETAGPEPVGSGRARSSVATVRGADRTPRAATGGVTLSRASTSSWTTAGPTDASSSAATPPASPSSSRTRREIRPLVSRAPSLLAAADARRGGERDPGNGAAPAVASSRTGHEPGPPAAMALLPDTLRPGESMTSMQRSSAGGPAFGPSEAAAFPSREGTIRPAGAAVAGGARVSLRALPSSSPTASSSATPLAIQRDAAQPAIRRQSVGADPHTAALSAGASPAPIAEPPVVARASSDAPPAGPWEAPGGMMEAVQRETAPAEGASSTGASGASGSGAPASGAAPSGGSVAGMPTGDRELDDLAHNLYDRLRSRLRMELLIDRERSGTLSDLS